MPAVKKYKHTLRWYSDTYVLKYQTIQRAKKRGWALDNPKKLLSQIEAVRGGNKPDLTTLRRLVNGDVEGLQDDAEPPAAASSQETSGSGSDESSDVDIEAVQFSMAIAGGLMGELERLKKETLHSYRLYLAEKRPADKMVRNKIWLANVAALRQLAKEAPKAERDAKNVLVVGDVDNTWSRTFKEFKSSVESLGRRVSTLPLFAGLDPIDVEEAIGKETVVMLSHLESGSWLDGNPKK